MFVLSKPRTQLGLVLVAAVSGWGAFTLFQAGRYFFAALFAVMAVSWVIVVVRLWLWRARKGPNA